MKQALSLLLLWYIKAGERRSLEIACGYPDDWCGDKLVFEETRKYLKSQHNELKELFPTLDIDRLTL